jgi:hypothetical protein
VVTSRFDGCKPTTSAVGMVPELRKVELAAP